MKTKILTNIYGEDLYIGDIIAVGLGSTLNITQISHASQSGNFIGTHYISRWGRNKGFTLCIGKTIIPPFKLELCIKISNPEIIKVFKQNEEQS